MGWLILAYVLSMIFLAFLSWVIGREPNPDHRLTDQLDKTEEIAQKSLQNFNSLYKEYARVVDICMQLIKENESLRSIVTTTNACDEYLRQQEEDSDGNS